MRRSGSAAPHRSWSPTVKAAEVLAAPCASLRRRPTGTSRRAGDGGRRQLARATRRGRSARPCTQWLRRGQHALDLVERHVARQLDGERLAVAAHRADAHADAVDRDRAIVAAEDLVGLGLRLPLLAALAVAEVLVDPGQQAAGERHAEVLRRQRVAAQRLGHARGRCRESPRPDRRAGPSPTPCAAPICASSSRMFCAPAPEAAW